MKPIGKAVSTVLVLTVLALSMGACFSQSGSNTGTTTPQPQAKRILRATFNWPDYIDPAVGSDYVASCSFVNLYDTLVIPSDDGSVKPHLAESWNVSEDGLKWTFRLRKGVRFHSGNELTAHDVVFSMDRLIKIGEGYGYLFAPYVEKTTAPDDYTVEFILRQPFGPFLSALVRLYVLDSKLVMEHLDKTVNTYGDMYDYGKQYLLAHDAGSGPYMVKDMKPEESLLAEKFDGYWLPFDKDNPEGFKFIGNWEPVTVRTLMARRELEISDMTQPEENLETMDKMPGIDIASFEAGSVVNLMLHTRKPPTDDIHFRKALAYAFDYGAATSQIIPGAKKAVGPVSSILPGADPNLPQYERNMEKAKEELGLSKYAKELDKYEVVLQYPPAPMQERLALLFQANAAELGIKVKVENTPWLTLVQNVAKPDSTPNVAVIEVSPHYAEAGSMLESRYHSKSTGTWEQTEWLKLPEVDKAIEDALATVDTKARLAKYQEIQRRIVDLCPTIWVFDKPEKHAYQSAYVEWPAAQAAASGGKVNPVMGYLFYMRNIKVYPDKVPAPVSGQ